VASNPQLNLLQTLHNHRRSGGNFLGSPLVPLTGTFHSHSRLVKDLRTTRRSGRTNGVNASYQTSSPCYEKGRTKRPLGRLPKEPLHNQPLNHPHNPLHLHQMVCPPTNADRRSPPSNYVPLPLDAYLRPTLPHSYAAPLPTPTTAESSDPSVDLLTSVFGAVMPPQDSHLSNITTFGPSMESSPLGFDIDLLLLDLMGTGHLRKDRVE
jgi:hypothetical protein